MAAPSDEKAGREEPRLADHFERRGILGVLRDGHPYDALETYELIEALYGYRTRYVNYGLWAEGPATEEPGRRLAFLAADALSLAAGERLLDAGAGLGQAAVDLARRHGLARVLGVNLNARQASFANALARAAGLEGTVRHEVADAARALAALEPGSFDALLALECAGHFKDPDGFLERARAVLGPGGRIALTLNVARRAPTRIERALFRAAYGFVPAPGEEWGARLARAGFHAIERRDLTRESIGAVVATCLARLARPTSELARIPRLSRAWTGFLLRAAGRAIERGALGYELISARAARGVGGGAAAGEGGEARAPSGVERGGRA
jgi:SAM-dependent methyltransferase